MTPQEKEALLNFLLWEEKQNEMSIIVKYDSKPLRLNVSIKKLIEKLADDWKDDIFMCPSCNGYFTWEDSVKVTGDIVDGKAGSPSETVCKGCAKNE